MQTNIRPIRIAQLKIDTAFQVRTALNPDTITEYAEATIAGEILPPVKVVKHNGTYILADGFHRVEAARQAGKDVIRAEIVEGDESKALEIAVTANRQHGLRMTSADKRRAIELVLRNWPEKSNRQIARLVGCTDPTVASVKQSMLKFSTSGPPDAPLSPEDQARLEQALAAFKLQAPEVRDLILTTIRDLLEAEGGRPNKDNECWWVFFQCPVVAALSHGKILSLDEVKEVARFANEVRAKDESQCP
jgi:ParB-like chromosome segregation protein Spo0J